MYLSVGGINNVSLWFARISYVKLYLILQLLFLCVQIITGLTMKTQIMGDSTAYFYISRYIAHYYIEGVTLLPGVNPMNAEGGLGLQPNLIYPYLISPLHVFHDYISVKLGIVVVNSMFVVLGVHALYKIYNMLVPHASFIGLVVIIVSGHFYPYTNFVTEVMVEPLYYAAFFWFCYFCLNTINQTVSEKKLNVKAVIFFTFLCVLFFYIKQIFLIFPVIFIFTMLLAPYFFRIDCKFSLKIILLFSFFYILFFFVSQQFVPVDGIGRYSKDVSIYNFNDIGNILITYYGSILNLFSYILFLPILFLGYVFQLLYKLRVNKENLDGENKNYIIVSIIIILTLLSIPLVMSLHSVSHLNWAYPGKSWYIYHERLYGFLIPLLSLVVFARFEEIVKFMSPSKIILLIACFIFIQISLQVNVLEPYAELLAAVNYSLSKFFDISIHFALIIPFVILLILLYFTRPFARLTKLSPMIGAVILVGVYLAALKGSGYLYTKSLSEGHKFISSKIKKSDLLIVDNKYPPSTGFLLMTDNRIKQVYSENVLKQKYGYNTNTILAMSYSKYKNILYDMPLLLKTSVVEKIEQSDVILLSNSVGGEKFVVDEYYSKSLSGDLYPMTKVGVRKQPSKTKIYPWIDKSEINSFIVHPAEEYDAIIKFRSLSDDALKLRLTMNLSLLNSDVDGDGTILSIKLDNKVIIKYLITNEESQYKILEFNILPNSEIVFSLNKGKTAFLDATKIENIMFTKSL
jgi:hypothetical protein